MKSICRDLLAWISVFTLFVLVLSSCGNESSLQLTATTAPTPLFQTTPLIASPVTTEGTIGALADRIARAWSNVRTYRVTSTSWTTFPGSPVAVATPVDGLPHIVLIDEIVLPDRHHRIQTEHGQAIYELLVVDGVIYARGSAVPGVTPVADAAVWILVDPATLQVEPFASFYAGLLQPAKAPYSGLSADERDRVAHPLGSVIVNERTCQQYLVADTTNTGERIDVRISIGDDDLLCSIETQVGSTTNLTTFDYNVPISIEAPR